MEKKKQKRLAILLSCLVLLTSMVGCSNVHDSTLPTPSEGTAATNPTEVFRYDPSDWPQLVAYTQKPVLSALGEKDIYISLKNQNCDFYPDAVYNGVAFHIITRNHYQPDEISVIFPGETPCEVKVTKHSEAFQKIALDAETDTYNDFGQQPYHYLCMQDIDLFSLGQQRSNANYAAEAYNHLVQNNQASVEDFEDLIQNYVDPYNALFQSYMGAYADQGTQKQTDYNAYTINLIFDQEKYIEETINYIDLNVGDAEYHLEFGEWRIHEESFGGANQALKGIKLGTVAILGASGDSPYAKGYMKMNSAIRFNTNEDIVLKSLRCVDGTEAEILGAQIENATEDNSINYFWNGKDPVRVESASNLAVSLYLYSDRFKEYEMNMTTIIYVDYVVSSTGAEYTFSVPCRISRHNKLWDTFCLAFLGVDVGEYYHYFGDEVMELYWLNEIPESWRKE